MEWIKCSERMPPKRIYVIACDGDGSMWVAFLSERMTWDDGDFFDNIQGITHWMPLPPPPTE